MCQAIIIAGIDKYTVKKHWAKELADLKELVELKNQKKIKGFKLELYINKINGIRLVGGLAGIMAGVIIGLKMTDFVNNTLIKKTSATTKSKGSGFCVAV